MVRTFNHSSLTQSNETHLFSVNLTSHLSQAQLGFEHSQQLQSLVQALPCAAHCRWIYHNRWQAKMTIWNRRPSVIVPVFRTLSLTFLMKLDMENPFCFLSPSLSLSQTHTQLYRKRQREKCIMNTFPISYLTLIAGARHFKLEFLFVFKARLLQRRLKR